MSEIPGDLHYTKEHEWVRKEGGIAYIGITDFAQSELGDIVFVELPEVGATLSAGQTFGTVESVKTVSDLFAPVSGRVTQVNADLADHPEHVNTQPYTGGWMIAVEVTTEGELLTADAYRTHIAE
jgi:glycine cleavage system H protein